MAVKAEGDAGLDSDSTAVRRAVEFGIDLTLLIENLKYTPTERVRRSQRSLESVVAVQERAASFPRRHRP
jgi:hypothetical protein